MSNSKANVIQEALSFHRKGDFTAAACLYSDLLEEGPENADTIFLLGTLKLQQGDLQAAHKLLKKVTTLKPDHAAAYNNLGTVLKKQNRPDKAVKCYIKSITLNPDYAMAHCNLGNLLIDLGRFAEAETSCRRAISLQPDYADAYNNLASTLQKQGKHDIAIASYNLAIKYGPESIPAHINRSSALLLTENFEEAWPEYEWRLHTKNCNSGNSHQTFWDGLPLNGKTILVHAEQGFGDTIQFVRYLPMVREQGGHVIFECQKHLISLLENYIGIDRIIEKRSKPYVNFDTHIHLLSLPGIFGTRMDSIPSNTPYITVSPAATERWRIKLANNNDFKIGIVWAGSPTFKDYYRSCSLDDFAPLAEIPNITFYSLQKGPASEEVFNSPKDMKIIDLEKELSDFSETAAVMKNLDLIISTDTAAAHLAGAIGKPIWTLLHTASDWRWFLNREDSPWYPCSRQDYAVGQTNGQDGRTGMRLFRQNKFNDWKGVFDQVREALLQEISDYTCLPFPRPARLGGPARQELQNIPKTESRKPATDNLLQEALKHHQAGDLNSAIIFYKKFIVEQPDHAMAHCNLGSALQGPGNFDDTIACYRKAIELRPDYVDAHYNLGNTLRALGNINEAVASYRQTVSLQPDNAELHSNLGTALQESGKLDEAIISYRQAIALKPNYAMAHCNLGTALHESGKLNDAVLSYNKAIEIKQNFALAHNNLGTTLKDLRKLNEAVESYKKAITLQPDYAEAHDNLGTAFQEQHKLDDAIMCHKRAITIKPDYAEAYNNLGTVLKELCKLDEAITNYRKAITLKPDLAEAYNNLGTALQDSGKIEEALASYKQATTLKPDFPLAHLNRSFALLLTEDFKEGWQEHKWRRSIKGHPAIISRRLLWDGKPLNNKTILVHTEQGLGDTILFARYLPMLKAQGGRVILECQQGLYHLLKNCNGIDEIIEKNSSNKLTVHHDVHIYLLDLPEIFETTLDSIPSNIPYITPCPILKSQWASMFNDDKGFKIGIVWAGNPRHVRDHNRSCTPTDFARLADVPGLSFYSLQKGHSSLDSDGPSVGMKIVNLESKINDFVDTAAVIANLDLVISVDTAVAHLTGAIGKPIWTLLPFAPDWRWLLKRVDSPWYPTMRLFRQNQPGDWNGVFKQVKQRLLKHIKG